MNTAHLNKKAPANRGGQPDILELLAGGSDGMYAIDMTQRVVAWNRHAEEMLGWTPQEVLGRKCYEVIGGSQGGQGVCGTECSAFQAALRGSVAPSHRVQTHTKSGEAKWISISHVLVPSDSRGLGALIHIFRDATQQVEAEKTLQRLASMIQPATHINVMFNPPDQDTPATRVLTQRETEVLKLLAQGAGNSGIAEKLVLTNTTVRNHIQHILDKLNVHTRLEAVIYASRHGLI